MEIVGRITQVLPEKSGSSARGPWRKQEYILETAGDYPKAVCFMVWGERIDQFAIREGQELRVSVNLESREFNSRWYTDVKAWRVEPADDERGGRADPGAGGEPPPSFDDEPPF